MSRGGSVGTAWCHIRRRCGGSVGRVRVREWQPQSKNVESNAYALDSAPIQISLGLRQPRAHWIQARWIHLEWHRFRPNFNML